MTVENSEPLPAETWHRVADGAELADGALKSVIVGGHPMVLVRVGERFGALDNRCPHAGGPLAEGVLENGLLVCPWHGREYNPITGACAGYDQPVRAYKVDARPDGIYVAL